MPTDTEQAIPVEVQGWITAFRSEQPLYKSFPILLPNGGRVNKFTGICSGCKEAIDHEMVRGRVMWSLPTVATVEANGYCHSCQKITHLHCRFRAHGQTYKVEWPDLDGRWYAKVATQTPWWRRVVQIVRRSKVLS